MSVSKEELRRLWSAHRYWVTEKGCKTIPKKVLDKWSPQLRERAREYYAKKQRIAKHGVMSVSERYHSEKHNNQTVNVQNIKHLQIKLVPGQSKNWSAHYIKIGNQCSKTTKTADKNKALEFAVKWYKETIVPSLQKSSKVNVSSFIKEHFTFLGKSKWNHQECGFLDLPTCPTKNSGVYVIMLNGKVLKVGKADGAKGLQYRLKSYASKNKSRITGKFADQFTIRLDSNMRSPELSGKSLSFYYHATAKVEKEYHGIKVETCIARSLEKQLSILCRLQNHPMTLSGSD